MSTNTFKYFKNKNGKFILLFVEKINLQKLFYYIKKKK